MKKRRWDIFVRRSAGSPFFLLYGSLVRPICQTAWSRNTPQKKEPRFQRFFLRFWIWSVDFWKCWFSFVYSFCSDVTIVDRGTFLRCQERRKSITVAYDRAEKNSKVSFPVLIGESITVSFPRFYYSVYYCNFSAAHPTKIDQLFSLLFESFSIPLCPDHSILCLTLFLCLSFFLCRLYSSSKP